MNGAPSLASTYMLVTFSRLSCFLSSDCVGGALLSSEENRSQRLEGDYTMQQEK